MKLTSLFKSSDKNALTKDWLRQHLQPTERRRCKIQPDGAIDVFAGVYLDIGTESLPDFIQFNRVQGTFHLEGPLISLRGSPRIVDGSYRIKSDRRIDSLEGIPTRVGQIVDFDDAHLDHLHDIHKYCKVIGQHINSRNCRSHALGVMMITALKSVHFDNSKVSQIMNHNLLSDERDIYKCQQELIDAGFADYAKL